MEAIIAAQFRISLTDLPAGLKKMRNIRVIVFGQEIQKRQDGLLCNVGTLIERGECPLTGWKFG